jgi:hypothetical protein
MNPIPILLVSTFISGELVADGEVCAGCAALSSAAREQANTELRRESISIIFMIV